METLLIPLGVLFVNGLLFAAYNFGFAAGVRYSRKIQKQRRISRKISL